jgi:MSHA pilin protein MshD
MCAKARKKIIQAKRQLGVTLIELVVFIVIVSVASAGVLKVLEITSKCSSDPLIRKQALAIAESLLLEIQQQPFTFCDPDDANAASATSAASCANSQDKGGAGLTSASPSTESRYSNTDPFDNVADYGGFTMPGGGCTGICSAGNSTPLTNLTGYAATVTISRAGAAAPYASLALDEALKISVRVTGPANTDVTLIGYRVRYAPNI